MAERSAFLSALSKEERAGLERRLLDRQSGRCFICDDLIDLTLHEGQLDVDHIQPLAEKGPDEENNLALTHASCNRSKARPTSASPDAWRSSAGSRHRPRGTVRGEPT